MKKKFDSKGFAKVLSGAVLSIIFFILAFFASNFINHILPVIISLVLIMALGIYLKKFKDPKLGSGVLIGFAILLVFVIFLLSVARGMH